MGGFGIANIMFVSVKERTREIGIRKAIGAPSRAILIQFLTEATAICLAGGFIGVGLTLLFSKLIEQMIPAILPIETVLMALGLCVAIGLVAGFAPAWAAAKSEPVEALRYE